MHRPNALYINAETMYDYQIILLPPALECSYVSLWQYPLQWRLIPSTPHLLPAHGTASQESQSTHRVAIGYNSISVHTCHFKYLETFLTNRFECLFCISKHVSQRDMESTYRKWRNSRRAGLTFVRILRARTTPNFVRSHKFSGSHCGCLSWFRDRVQRTSVRNSFSIFPQNVNFSLRITRLQSVVNTVFQCKGKAIPVKDPEGSQISRQSAYEGGKIVRPTHQPPLPPVEYSWYSFLLEAESTPGP
jgi:hypothetical protein